MDGNTTTNLSRVPNGIVKYLLISISLILMFVLGYYINDSVFSIRDYLKKESSSKVTETINEDEEDEVVNRILSSKLILNNKEIELPEGWFVNSFSTFNKPLSDSDKNTLLKEGLDEGRYPIYRGMSFSLSNGNSVISIEYKTDYIAGPFGLYPDKLENDWNIVIEPTKDSTYGYARKIIDGIYSYKNIQLCDDESICGKYMYIDGPGLLTYTFKGNSEDLKISDQLYKTYMLDPETMEFELEVK